VNVFSRGQERQVSMARRAALALAALGLIATTAGCTGSGSRHAAGSGVAVAGEPSSSATARPAADGVQQVVIDTTDDNHFKPDVVFARPGRLRITVTNPSVVPVDLVIPTLGVRSITIFAGRSSTVDVDVPAAGSYPFVCTFHAHEGMTGVLVVS
jgi:plastocyanin